ncbi:hypothetical protein GGE43_005047 [Agrobacterium tumefaciens]|uniref:Uncharacterized protein n=1 Tax=Agrobacterium radiobacter TaxID=362 RepID=A0ABR6JF30_AGRRD|nr:hypothetical protein [Agrobacterium radiobacter]CUX51072.1 hypothetical protein AGR4B_pAt10011 [Agrobacterium tumefaciens str. CFBP 5621]MBB4338315.1 hypothetical protein [Agrobacterium radiobacter]MBB4493203.1 hypothetical protein [Agrobacterium radiobacter]MBB4498476.1 hypothetical protein [Agrobacterium radiobacter]
MWDNAACIKTLASCVFANFEPAGVLNDWNARTSKELACPCRRHEFVTRRSLPPVATQSIGGLLAVTAT